MAAFDDPLRMGRALSALHAGNVGLGELGVLGIPSSVDGMHRAIRDADTAWHQFSPLFASIEPLPFIPLQGGIPVQGGVVGTAQRLMTPARPAGTSLTSHASAHDCLIPAAQRARLADSIAGGAVVLLANPMTQDKWMHSTRVLLQHSRHPVQSHEIAMPQGLPPLP